MIASFLGRRRSCLHSLQPLRVALVATTLCLFVFFALTTVEFSNGAIAIHRRPSLLPSSDSEPSVPFGSDPPEYNTEGYDENQLSIGDYRLLTSKRNNQGYFNAIKTLDTGVKIFNPTLLELPRGCQHEFMIIARTFHKDEEINGVKYKRAGQLAVFANMTYSRLGRPQLTTGPWSRSLVENFMGPEHHCKGQPKMDKYIGPEDMKLFWTRDGAPLLIFTHQTPDENLCEGMFLIDARAAVPELEQVLGPQHAFSLPPIVFREPTLLRREAPEGHEGDRRYQREKNWAPVQSPFSDDDSLYFMAEPGQLYKWVAADQPVQQVETEPVSAVMEPYPPGAETTWHSTKTCMHDVMRSEKRIHQSTPMLSLTLCNRGECEPDPQNTLLLGMVQQRFDPPYSPSTWYRRRIVAYNATAPYNFISVSKRLTYHGESDGQFVWTGSMVYYVNSTEIPQNRSHGYLDDEIRLSFGVKDKAPGWIDIDARDLVTDHYFCEGARPFVLPGQ